MASSEKPSLNSPGALLQAEMRVGAGGSPGRGVEVIARATPQRGGSSPTWACHGCRRKQRCVEITAVSSWLWPPAARMLSSEKLRCNKTLPLPGEIFSGPLILRPMRLANASSCSSVDSSAWWLWRVAWNMASLRKVCEQGGSQCGTVGWVSLPQRDTLLLWTKWLGCPAGGCACGEHTGQLHGASLSPRPRPRDSERPAMAGSGFRIAARAPRPSRRRPARSVNAECAGGCGWPRRGCAGSSGRCLCSECTRSSSWSRRSSSSSAWKLGRAPTM
mmetsp:Transcript_42748/g.124248  ORF Transcript_42748/g.124248 Transcript_42748/m.124248 type:complete len:275 (+) Transcript_42748:558-1382(+)